jgi:hypothetical protein
MPSILVRPASADDIAAFSNMPGKPTIRAMALVIDDEVVGLGGVAFMQSRWLGFVDLKPEARQYKTTIARAAIRFLAELRRDGVRFIYVQRDEDEPRAGLWLASLGFEIDPRSQQLLRWKA